MKCLRTKRSRRDDEVVDYRVWAYCNWEREDKEKEKEKDRLSQGVRRDLDYKVA